MKHFLILCVFIGALSFGKQEAVAQRYVGDCENARSTADTLSCVKQRAETAQTQLNELYKKVQNAQPENIETSLGATQQSWIAYRNAQCAWEADYAEAGYEKIYELSCLASLTDQRIAALNTISEAQSRSAPREFSSHPRWMNALADDHPDVLWRYNQWLQADVDCDGAQEEVMTGIVMQARDLPPLPTVKGDRTAGKALPPLYRAEAVIALSENDGAGRPKTRVFRLPIGKNEQTMFFCSMPQSLAEISVDVVTESEEDEELAEGSPKTCTTQIEISDGDCVPAVVYWDGEGYQMKKNKIGSDEIKNID